MIRKITIHHSMSPDVPAETIKQWHIDAGLSDIGYHFVIRRDGNIEEGRPGTKMGAHVKGKNWHNLGICLTGNFEEHEPSEAQYEALGLLLKILEHTFQIPKKRVFLHKDIAATLCPGKNFDRYQVDLKRCVPVRVQSHLSV